MPASRQNPFPGLNPWLQRHWPDVHLKLLSYISDAVSGELPDDLVARTEQQVTVEEGGDLIVYRPDVAVKESWQNGFPPVWQPAHGAGGIPLAAPLIIHAEPPVERWIEIRDRDGHLVTVIEVISPSNKREPGWTRYKTKQRALLAAGVNLVEIDLIRGGNTVLAVDEELLKRPEGTHSTICVARQHSPSGIRWEVYLTPLSDPLPAFRVPLRAGEHDVPLILQPLLEAVYQNGRYWMENYSLPPVPPLPAADALWADQLLKDAGLRE